MSYICTKCRAKHEEHFEYCPNCGAKMDYSMYDTPKTGEIATGNNISRASKFSLISSIVPVFMLLILTSVFVVFAFGFLFTRRPFLLEENFFERIPYFFITLTTLIVFFMMFPFVLTGLNVVSILRSIRDKSLPAFISRIFAIFGIVSCSLFELCVFITTIVWIIFFFTYKVAVL